MNKPLSVLIVDDAEDIRALLEHWLAAPVYDVKTAGTGREARAWIEQRAFDLVITDVLMPEGDGPGLIAEVRKLQPLARILAISGGGRYVESDDCLKIARGLGAHAALLKPFGREGLFEAIARARGTSGLPRA